ncbi:MAG: hypothetical protein ABSG60_02705 [Terracidiphilus sp.]
MAAAAHVGDCESCQARLREYIALGAEMRRAASLEMEQELNPMVWETKRGSISTVWQKGWETMRIPRFAFAALVMGIVALGSTLAVVKVRAHSEGSVVILAVNRGSGDPDRCPLSTVDKNWAVCVDWKAQGENNVGYQIDLLGRDGNRVQLGVRTMTFPILTGAATNFQPWNLAQAEQKIYWFEPGESLRVDVPGVGALTVTGEWTDHMPPPGSVNARNQNLDPGPNELRIVSPMLLRDKKVVGDMEGQSAIADEPGGGVLIYFPGEGCFVLSLQQMDDAVQGQIKENRISFQSDGHAHTFLTAEPVARSQQVWILHNPRYTFSDLKYPILTGWKDVKVLQQMTATKQ